MTNLERVKSICRQYGLAPQKSRGQNFLIDEDVVAKILAVAEVNDQETILEVGPGLGILTAGLLKVARQVLAVELDLKAIDFLKNNFASVENLTVISGDILKINLSKTLDGVKSYRIIANLPYNITSHFLRIFLELKENKPREMILMLQKEVAERITASSGAMSKLSVMVQYYGQPEIIFNVSKNSFWPKPAVDSAVVRIKVKPDLPQTDIKKFFQTVNIGFSARRKQLHNNLAGGFKISSDSAKAILTKAGFSSQIRAQALSVEDWIKLTEKIMEHIT